MEQHQDVFSPLSPVAGWTPAPDAPSPEGLVALLGAPRPAAKTAPKKQPHVAKGPAVERAARGSASAGSSKANLIAPFRERTSSAHAEAAGSSSGSPAKKVLQPRMSHGAAGSTRPAAPPRKMPGMLAGSTGTSSAAGGSVTTHKPGSIQQQDPAAAASSHRRSSASSTRPASQQAAVNVAAAEAAVSAAAAVIKVGTQAHHQQQQQQKKALSVQSRQQQQLRSRKSPFKSSTKDCTSSGSPQPCAASSSSGLSQYMLLEPLSVHGVPHSAARQSSTCAADGHSTASPRAAASCCGDAASSWLPSATRQGVSGNGTALQAQHAMLEQLHYQQLMLCPDSAPQTAAEILAARAKSRRMRIQQRNLLGPAAFARGTAQPRPASPPPILLDGALLLASCPGAEQPADVMFVDLNSVGVSSVALPCGMPPTQLTAEDNIAMPTPAATAEAAADAAQAAAEVGDAAAYDVASTAEAEEETAAADVEQAAAPAEAEGVLPVQTLISGGAAALPAVADAAMTTAEQQAWHGPGLQEYSQLCTVDLSDNRLSCIAGLAWLPALQQLILSANRLRDLQGLAQVLCTSCTASCSAAAQEPSAADEQQEHTAEEHEVEGQKHKAAAAAVPQCNTVGRQLCCPSGLSCLRLLDVSFNLIPAEQLLGVNSPLARLPGLAALYAAGSSLRELPQQLGPFTCLSCLDLSHNRLGGAALMPLGQLPALQQLLLSHNPIRQVPASDQQQKQQDCQLAADHISGSGSMGSAAAAGAGSAGFQQLVQLDLSHTKVSQSAQLLPLLLLLPRLAELQLVGTPLAARCWSGSEPVKDLQKPGLCIIIQEDEPQALWQHTSNAPPPHKAKRRQQPTASGNSSRGTGHASSSSSPRRLLPVTVDAAAEPGHVLAAAGRNAIMGLQHQQLVAVFERVEQGIGSWQLAPVAEEGSKAWDCDGDEEEQLQQQQGQRSAAAAGSAEAGEPVVDQTFLTGVGITGELPGDGDEEAADAGQQAADDSFQDPTERLALALGLQVCQLAHYTHRQPGNPLAAIHRLRHALAHPLVDADAGMQPPQHHTGMTAAALAKQRPRQLLPLPQPIPATLGTRVKAVQGIEAVLTSMRGRLQVLEGTLLQQLQAQSDKLSAVAQAMSHNAAECGEGRGAQADQPTADTARTDVAEEFTVGLTGC